MWIKKDLPEVVALIKNYYLRHSIKKNVAMLTWYPSEAMVNITNYVRVAFQLCELNLAKSEKDTFGCEYEIKRIVKLSWSAIKKIANPVYVAMLRMTLNDSDYQSMIQIYNENKNKSYQEIACTWVRNNNKTWSTWGNKSNRKEVIYIGGIFPYPADVLVHAANMAATAINANNTTLQGYNIQVIHFPGNCSVETVLTSFIDYIKWSDYAHLAGVLGPSCTETVEPIAAVSRHYRNVIISYSAEGADYSDRKLYPYFFRTIGENIQYKHVYLALFKQLGWKRIAALTKDGQKYTQYITHVESLLSENNITFIANSKFPNGKQHTLIPRVSKFSSNLFIGDDYQWRNYGPFTLGKAHMFRDP